MACLKFDDSDDRLRYSTLASPLANVGNGAWTCAVLLRFETITNWNAVVYLLSAGGGAQAGLSYTSASTRMTVDAGGLQSNFAFFIPNTTDTYILVGSKAAGTVAPRLGVKNLTTDAAWAHGAGGTNLADQATSGILDIGVWQGTSDPMDGWIGLVGWWEGAMSDAEKEDLSIDKQTSTWYNHSFGLPQFLAELNVAAGSVVDLAGNASNPSHVGTTLDTGEGMEGWNWDGIGPQGGASATYEILATVDDGYAAAENIASYPPTPPNAARWSGEHELNTEKIFDGNYYISNSIVRFDTSEIPDDATITSATLVAWVRAKSDVDSRSLVMEWYDWVGDPHTDDYSSTVVSDAHAGTTLASLTADQDESFALQNLENINKSGWTGIRFHISGGAPSGLNYVNFAQYDAVNRPARLFVTYTSPKTEVIESPATVVSDTGSGDNAWSNPGNAVSDNDTWASTGTLFFTTTTEYLKATDFGFAIPTDDLIYGIIAYVKKKNATTSLPSDSIIRDESVRLVIADVISGDDKATTAMWANYLSGGEIWAYGSADSLWGLSITPADVNDADFGVAIAAVGADSVNFSVPNIDHIFMAVYHGEEPVTALIQPYIHRSTQRWR